MRRSDREVKEVEFMHRVLIDAGELYIALNADGAPYVFPVNHVLYDGCIYFHCAPEGRKLELLGRDPRVGFSTAVDVRVEGTTTRYRSVCGTGVAEIVDDPVHKEQALRELAARFSAPCVFPVSPEKLDYTQIIRISIETLTGKHSRPGEGPRPVPHFVS